MALYNSDHNCCCAPRISKDHRSISTADNVVSGQATAELTKYQKRSLALEYNGVGELSRAVDVGLIYMHLCTKLTSVSVCDIPGPHIVNKPAFDLMPPYKEKGLGWVGL